MNILWMATVFFATTVYPKLRTIWYSEMNSMEREDQEEYHRFQRNLTTFFAQYKKTNAQDGFEQL